LADTAGFVDLLNREGREYFAGSRDLMVARAPGRLDLMGGIADYSGSLVLQLPIAAAAHAAISRRGDDRLRIVSLSAGRDQPLRRFEMLLEEFDAMDYAAARERFGRDTGDHWAAYVAGAFLALKRELGCNFDGGADLLIRSEVPEGKGVSSSAALEVASMRAICAAYEIEVDPRELALLCQKVENLVAGAPCGVMDQMTAACGETDRLLELLCQPAALKGTVGLPAEIAVWGIDSGIRHAVTGADYGTVRTAAFMGYRMIAEMAGLNVSRTGIEGRVTIDDARWAGYLANIAPEEFDREFAGRLPAEIDGAEFLERFGGITDAVTSVQSGRVYPVAQSARHPVREHARVAEFAEILKDWRGAAQAERLGELMYQSHESYSACGLGSDGTDEIVRLVREAGVSSGLFGAKITGGGSGGTVAVLGLRAAEDAARSIAGRYAQKSGRQPVIIAGSSPGAGEFGHLRLSGTER
jgi:L-arabinokinase